MREPGAATFLRGGGGGGVTTNIAKNYKIVKLGTNYPNICLDLGALSEILGVAADPVAAPFIRHCNIQ
jgi:hypothetical protein